MKFTVADRAVAIKLMLKDKFTNEISTYLFEHIIPIKLNQH